MIFWVNVSLCVCVFWEALATHGIIIWSAGHRRQPDRLTACVCGQHAKSPGLVYTLKHTPTLLWCCAASSTPTPGAFVCHCTSETKPCHTSSGKSSDCRFVIAAIVLTQLVTTSDTSLSPDAHATIRFHSDIRVHSYYRGFATETGFGCHVTAVSALKELMWLVETGVNMRGRGLGGVIDTECSQ